MQTPTLNSRCLHLQSCSAPCLVGDGEKRDGRQVDREELGQRWGPVGRFGSMEGGQVGQSMVLPGELGHHPEA